MMPPKRHNRSGFSLTELLVVMAIISLMAAISGPFVLGMLRGSQTTQDIVKLSTLLDQARQHAIARNTYVWVAYTDQSSAPQDGTLVVVVESRTGCDALGWTTSAVSLTGNADLQLLGKVESLPGIHLSDAGTVTTSGAPAAAGVLSASQVNLQAGSGSQAKTFDRAIQFSPAGEARVRVPGQMIDVSLRPINGEEKNAAVIRLAGLSGKVRVYRPEGL